jgi:hypothetical protein
VLDQICSPVTGSGDNRQIAEKLLVQLKQLNKLMSYFIPEEVRQIVSLCTDSLESELETDSLENKVKEELTDIFQKIQCHTAVHAIQRVKLSRNWTTCYSGVF